MKGRNDVHAQIFDIEHYVRTLIILSWLIIVVLFKERWLERLDAIGGYLT